MGFSYSDLAYEHPVPDNSYGVFAHVSNDPNPMRPEEYLAFINGPIAAVQEALRRELGRVDYTWNDGLPFFYPRPESEN